MNNAKQWTIYCHTHVESGRKYVGLTSQTMMKRWNRHMYDAMNMRSGNTHFANAIRKYGKDAFSHEILEKCNSLEDANLTEQKWIGHFNSRNPEKGFNLMKGGEHTPHPVKNPWNRSDYRAKNLPRILNIGNTHQARAASKAALNTPESKAKRSALAKIALARPETIAKRKILTADPEYRLKISTRTKEALASEETKTNVSNGIKKLWSDPVYRKKLQISLQEVMSKPECKKKMSEAQKIAWANPEIRAKRVEAFKKDAIRPEKKAKLSKAALGKHHTSENIDNMRLLYLQRSSSCKFCDRPIEESEKRTCINGRVACRICKAIHDQKEACFLRPDKSFLIQ